jgi:MerR family transcriptional regulator, light-induced transcriptional regulator
MSVDLSEQQAQFTAALRRGDEAAARVIVERALADGATAPDVYYDLFAPGMVTIGELWERNELSVAEEHLATAITERLIGLLSPSFDQPADQAARGSVVLGCVQGERHALGLRMLSDLFRQAGWRVLYLGADVPNADWVRLAVRINADIVAISAGSTRLLPQVEHLIAELRAALPALGVLVGGAAFSVDGDAWRAVGADLFHPRPQIAVAQATARYLSHLPAGSRSS